MSHLFRKGDGQPIRDAMRAKKLSGPALAARTKAIDVTGKGISPATVAKVAASGEAASERPRLRTCWLMAKGLGEPLQDLFDMPGVSTVTDERATLDADPR